jgi:glyoxylase I family protein
MTETTDENDALTIYGTAPLLQVFDMPTSLAFYRKLGFVVASQSEPESGDDCNWALLKCYDVELMLNTQFEKNFRPPVPDPQRTKTHADTTLYFGCADINGLYQKFISMGLVIKEPFISQYNFKAIGFKDPDGYGLCFHWPVQ